MMNDARTEEQRLLELFERQLDALKLISLSLNSYTGEQRVLREVVEILDRRLWFMRSTIMLLNACGEKLMVETLGSDSVNALDKVNYARGEGITGRVLQTGEPAVIERISKEPQFMDRIHRRGADSAEYSFICVPIIVDRMVVGTLSVDVPYRPERSLGHSLRFVTIVAGMIANDVKVRRAARVRQEMLEKENQRLRDQLQEQYRPENIIGNSHEMRRVYQLIHRVSTSDTSVLIRGETGSGKELVASAIHYKSDRAAKPYVKVNCAALTESLIESELFGHEQGAFTGANHTRIGYIEEAEGGTLFLDEIGDFSSSVQVKLLRVLQEKKFQRVGSNQLRTADIRIIAATNVDLERAVEEGRFRQDLYYRINVFPIILPALRHRRDDIMLLADHFVAIYSRKMNKKVNRISTEAINMIMAYHWPGNVRELENCIEHAVLMSTDNVIHGFHLPPSLQMPEDVTADESMTLKFRVHQLERELITESLKRSGGSIRNAAAKLGITERMVRYKIDNLHMAHGKRAGKRKQGR